MERTHLSMWAHDIVVEPREQDAQPQYKPEGIWYEVDGDWRRWNDAEGYFDSLTMTLHRVELGDERMLYITTVDELDAFTAQYGVIEYVRHPFEAKPLRLERGIEWSRVADEYDGIEIAPYQWSRRLELSWYYGWDCASGVIWQPRGVKVAPAYREAMA